MVSDEVLAIVCIEFENDGEEVLLHIPSPSKLCSFPLLLPIFGGGFSVLNRIFVSRHVRIRN